MSSVVRCWLRDYYRLDTEIRLDIDLAITVLTRMRILSPRERAVLKLAKEDYTYAEMADKLKIARNTAQRHMRVAASKIAVYLDIYDSDILDTIERHLDRKLTSQEKNKCLEVLARDGKKSGLIFSD